jgi:hypothetical protein
MLDDKTIITALEEVLQEKPLTAVRQVYFIAGTLCVDSKDPEEECTLINFKDTSLNPNVRLLLARIYLKHKTERHAFYEQAQCIVEAAAK